MSEDKKLQKALDLVNTSLLSDERKEFWCGRFRENKVSPDDMRELLDEMDAAIDVEKEELAKIDREIADGKKELEGLGKEQLNQFNRAYPLLLEDMDGVVSEMKKDADDIDEAVTEAIEHMKGDEEEKEMEAIRKKLKG